ncbi:DUF2252 domain-containing protein [Microbacterium flavum]|uniref:DUF2252 domain-containing protein n=2 Tax=Microbacterium flavum TaxID=415216 RepID=A0ABS5XU69_9MICO|nr:DUF2252 domain-containing protein [Microbacterium flavum]
MTDPLATGRERRRTAPRRSLGDLVTGGRDPLGILDAQNAGRVPELVPLRTQRMSASPFAFYRGTAALMAADLAASPSSGILVASCGDAHVANFGFYASPQRTLVFDLNDFDEAAWAPWEWDLKRLVASVIIAGRATNRDPDVVRTTALATVRTYARSMAAGVRLSPLERYYQHFDVSRSLGDLDRRSRAVVKAVMREAQRRTGERAARKLTEVGEDGRLRFIETPPTMTHAAPEITERVEEYVDAYRRSTNVDIAVLLQQYTASDTARRVVGVGSVGTRCYVTVLQDAAGHPLILQTKEAGRSVLEEYGRQPQPDHLSAVIREGGQGARVVALQRILQGVSDPFLGHMITGRDFYFRQFRDMKVSIEVETLEDLPFRRYAQTCAAMLARAHCQSPGAAAVTAYIGSGRIIGEAILAWGEAYADLSRADYDAFVARGDGARA